MSEYDANGFTVEIEKNSKARAPRGPKTAQQKEAEQLAAEFPYTWPIDDEALRAVKDRRLRLMVVRNAIQFARKQTAINAQQYMNERGIPPSVIARDIGMVQDSLFHAVNDEMFTMPTDALVKFCYKYLHMTVQEFLFGKPKPTMLPRKYRAIAKTLYAYQEDQVDGQARLYSLHTLGCRIFHNKMGVEWPLGVEDCGADSSKRYLERIAEYAGDRFLHVDNIEIDFNAKVAIRRMMADSASMSRGLMTAVMRTAMTCGETMDYFLARDYTMFGTVAFEDESGEIQIIHDRYALEIIGMLLSMPEKAHDEYFAKIVYRIQFEE